MTHRVKRGAFARLHWGIYVAGRGAQVMGSTVSGADLDGGVFVASAPHDVVLHANSIDTRLKGISLDTNTRRNLVTCNRLRAAMGTCTPATSARISHGDGVAVD